MSLDFVSPDTSIDLSNCDREPIHLPGTIQPHGYLFACDEDGRVTRASENIWGRFGTGTRVGIGEKVSTALPGLAPLLTLRPGEKLTLCLEDESFLAVCRESGEERYFEIEPEASDQVTSSLYESFHEAIASLSKMKDLNELRASLPRLIKHITGYDRVMLYQFDRDWHGQVAAEAREADLEPFLGLHYPATDIPVQARELYKRKLTRLIYDVDYVPARIASRQGLSPLDLSDGNLRSISPMHVQYLQNMKVRATLVISLMVHGQLWGLLACHHYLEPKYICPEIRTMCESVASVASFEIGSFLEIARRKEQNRKKVALDAFFGELSKQRSFAAAVHARHLNLLDLTHSSGLLLVEKNAVTGFGLCPSADEIDSFLPWLRAKMSGKDIFKTHHLKADYADAEKIKSQASGLLAVKLPPLVGVGSQESFLVWLRQEHAELIYWAGNPNKPVSSDGSGQVLTPRASFESWLQVKRDQSMWWEDSELEAAEEFRQRYLDFVYSELRMMAHQTQVRLAHLEKLSSIGQLTAGVAHDFNNILLGIQGAAQLTQIASQAAEVQQIGERIKTFCQRGAALVKGLLKHSRAPAEDYVPVNAVELLSELTVFVKTMSGGQHQFEISSHVGASEAVFQGSSTEILQCLLNLVNNAKDASTDPTKPICATLELDSTRNEIRFEVRDQGTGMSKETLDRIFDPFFSKKEAGKGTGLGLSSTKQIIMNHGGSLRVESEIGRGTVFTIVLPRAWDMNATGPVMTSPLPVKSQSDVLKRLNVLYVEDDPENRELYEELLSRHFKGMRLASNGEDGLQALNEFKPDLIISDLRMPRMDGVRFYREARKLLATVPFVLMTGELLTREELLGNFNDPAFDTISKPFDLKQFLDTCARLV